MLLAPVIVAKFVKTNFDKIQKEKINSEHKLSILFEEYRPRSVMFLCYHSFFMLRRFSFAAVIIFAKSDALVQNCLVVMC